MLATIWAHCTHCTGTGTSTNQWWTSLWHLFIYANSRHSEHLIIIIIINRVNRMRQSAKWNWIALCVSEHSFWSMQKILKTVHFCVCLFICIIRGLLIDLYTKRRNKKHRNAFRLNDDDWRKKIYYQFFAYRPWVVEIIVVVASSSNFKIQRQKSAEMDPSIVARVVG